ncbi:hypothetical protein V6Z11_D05G277000 [Gossypium hirsutum]
MVKRDHPLLLQSSLISQLAADHFHQHNPDPTMNCNHIITFNLDISISHIPCRAKSPLRHHQPLDSGHSLYSNKSNQTSDVILLGDKNSPNRLHTKTIPQSMENRLHTGRMWQQQLKPFISNRLRTTNHKNYLSRYGLLRLHSILISIPHQKLSTTGPTPNADIIKTEMHSPLLNFD